MDLFEEMSEEGIAAYFYSLWKKCFGKKDEDDNSRTSDTINGGRSVGFESSINPLLLFQHFLYSFL